MVPPPANHLPRDELERRLLAYAQEAGRNPLFSGTSADLNAWFDIVEDACVRQRIPRTQRSEAAILLIRTLQIALIMQERHRIYLEESNAPYWPWGEFRRDFEAVVREAEAQAAQNNGESDIDWERVGRTGLRLAQGAMFVPLIAILGLNIAGFTLGGVAAGSFAAAIQSIFYGGATGGVFSVLQAIGATATLEVPAILAGVSALSSFFGFGRSGGGAPTEGGAGDGPPHEGRVGDEPPRPGGRPPSPGEPDGGKR